MRPLLLLRAVVLLRRIAIALEDHNRIQRDALALQSTPMVAKQAKMSGVTIPSVDAWNQRYMEKQQGFE